MVAFFDLMITKQNLTVAMNKFTVLIILLAIAVQGCKKNNGSGNSQVNTGTDPGTIAPPNTPVTAKTQGFFLDDWQPKTFVVPTSYTNMPAQGTASTTVTVDVSQVLTKVSKYLFGNNTNPYMGQYVTEPVLMSYITALAPNILRCPGGSLSDVYFWNAASAQPADAPDTLLDSQGNILINNYWFGGNTQSWTFALDNYYKLLQQTNSTGIITVNYDYARYGTSASPVQAAAHLAANWVRYDKGRTKFWEVGNEDYGNWEAGYHINTAKNKDGQPQIISGALYGAHFKVFADSMRKAAADVGTSIKIGGMLIESASTYDAVQTNWNSGFLASAGGSTADYFIVHNYYTPYNQNSTADVILATAVSSTKAVMDYVNSQVQGAGLTQRPVALTEWNIQAVGANQQVSNIAGLHAVIALGELLKDQYSMASRWDMGNGWNSGNDQGMFNLGDEPGGVSKWNPRPEFYYMYYFQKYFGDQMVSSTVQGSADILSYASSFTSGQAGVVLVNKGTSDQVVNVKIKNYLAGSNFYYYALSGGAGGDFSRIVTVNGTGPTGVAGGPANYDSVLPYAGSVQNDITVHVPARSAVFLVCDKK